MTIGGWITFLLSTCSFTLLFAWCLAKVLRLSKSKSKHLHGAFDLEEIDPSKLKHPKARVKKTKRKK